MNKQELQNGIDEHDALDSESGEISALLRALPHVEAPGNFEFRVKARIAEGSKPRASLIPFLKIVAPLTLVFLIVAFVVFNGSSGWVQNDVVAENAAVPSGPMVAQAVPPVSQTEPGTDPEPQINGSTSGPAERVAAEPKRSAPRARRSSNPGVSNSSGGRSFDISVTPANVITAPGFESTNPNKKNINASVGGVGSSVPELLQILGISAGFANGGWKVRSITANTSAHKAGIVAGDVIEAIDGKVLTPNTRFSGEAKSIRVRRNGKVVDLNFSN